MKAKLSKYFAFSILVLTLTSALTGCVVVPTPFGAKVVPVVPVVPVPVPWYWGHRHY